MVLSWTQRLAQLSKIIGTDIIADDEDRQGQALDEFLASQKADKQGIQALLLPVYHNLSTLRFNDDDLSLVGRLAEGQFGTVDVVRCRIDSKIYVRKSMEKRTVLRARAQCSPQFERDILVMALKTDCVWVPRLLCAFQTDVSLKLVMYYADSGNLWDVIESSPEAKLPESDLKWWVPQMISAIEWCHSQGFVHRDIKPHNFVITPTSHLLLVDFGSAAPLLPPTATGVQLVPKEYCLVPCGTCDYISPEVLQCHEAALVALELEDDDETGRSGRDTTNDETCYGRETDWWSFGAMLYEMAFGVAPFFANDVGRTYVKIIEHRTSLGFDGPTTLSNAGISLLQGLLCDKEERLGRYSIAELRHHHYLSYVDWDSLLHKSPPSDLHLPHFTYPAAAPDYPGNDMQPARAEGDVLFNESEQFSRPFEFSVLFKSSRSFTRPSFLEGTPGIPTPTPNIIRAMESFTGFSWGPRINAFNPPSADTDIPPPPISHHEPANPSPRPTDLLHGANPLPSLGVVPNNSRFLTPIRQTSLPTMNRHTISIPRTAGTSRRRQGLRMLSDREAMQQLVECIGLSAHKKVLESGKKPMYIRTMPSRLGFKKEIKRFIPVPKPIIIDAKGAGDTSSASSETESQPPSPSPTPRPGSAMSRMSGWGGRSTPSLLTDRMTPTLTSGHWSGEFGSGHLSALLQEELNRAAAFDRKLRAAERRHDKLLNELSSLERDVKNVSLRLSRNT